MLSFVLKIPGYTGIWFRGKLSKQRTTDIIGIIYAAHRIVFCGKATRLLSFAVYFLAKISFQTDLDSEGPMRGWKIVCRTSQEPMKRGSS